MEGFGSHRRNVFTALVAGRLVERGAMEGWKS